MAEDWYLTGSVVPLTFNVYDADGEDANVTTANIVVLLPDGTTTSLTPGNDVVGTYTYDFVPVLNGRHIARFVGTGDNQTTIENVFDVQATWLAHVTVDEFRVYMDVTNWSDAAIAGAILAEQAAQRQRCFIDPYTHDLREALLRRVARNLAARAVPVATFTSFEGGGTTTRVPQTDPELTRLEGPYRRRTVG